MWPQVLGHRPTWVYHTPLDAGDGARLAPIFQLHAWTEHNQDTDDLLAAAEHQVRSRRGGPWVPPRANVDIVSIVWFLWDVCIEERLLHFVCAQHGLSRAKVVAVTDWLAHHGLAHREFISAS